MALWLPGSQVVWEDRDIPELVASNCTGDGLAVQSEVLETEVGDE